MSDMFCFQCEQTAAGKGCTKVGVCGKQATTALLQDQLTGKLVGLARALEGKTPDAVTTELAIDCLFTCITNVNFDDPTIVTLVERVEAAKKAFNADAKDFDLDTLWKGDEDVRSLKSLVLLGLRGMAAYARHALALGRRSADVEAHVFEALRTIGKDGLAVPELLAAVMKLGEVNLACMAMLDEANTGTYGTPVPTKVPTTIEKGPFIVVTGHDLHDLELLLKQTEGKGVNIYTHGEMLPSHAYPRLKAYAHLKGHFGTAWQNQQKEFDSIPGAVLFTTNCIMPVRPSYADRIFTTNVVQYPGMVHIGIGKDFSPVIAKALQLGGYKEDHLMTGINGGSMLTVGFGHGTVSSKLEDLIKAVEAKDLTHIFLVGGCDGAKTGRNYFTDFVKKTPVDSLVLTLACGKFRFNDLDLGTVGGLPRLMDMGQCNDSFSAIQVVVALSKRLGVPIDSLPLSIVLSWYEQKAVCVLLTLLFLGLKNIYLGPSLPAFVSPAVLNVLVERWQVTPISSVEKDMDAMLKK